MSMVHGEPEHPALPEPVELLSRRVIGCAIEVHRHLGPGLLESIYEGAIARELAISGVSVNRQMEIEVPYKGVVLRGQRLDMVAGGSIVLELKSVAEIHPVHKAQLLSYLRLANLPLGLLINFNVPLLREGLRRVINDRWSRGPIAASRSSRSESSRASALEVHS